MNWREIETETCCLRSFQLYEMVSTRSALPSLNVSWYLFSMTYASSTGRIIRSIRISASRISVRATCHTNTKREGRHRTWFSHRRKTDLRWLSMGLLRYMDRHYGGSDNDYFLLVFLNNLWPTVVGFWDISGCATNWAWVRFGSQILIGFYPGFLLIDPHFLLVFNSNLLRFRDMTVVHTDITCRPLTTLCLVSL